MSRGQVLGVSRNVVTSLSLHHTEPRTRPALAPGQTPRPGLDEHRWKHVRGQADPSFATVIVDLTPVIDGLGRARFLDMVAGCFTAMLGTLLGVPTRYFEIG